MSKRLLSFFLLGLSLLLSACAAKTTEPAQTVEAAEPTSTQRSTNLQTVAAPVDLPGCTLSSPIPTPGPTEQSLFPPSKESDWTRGPDDAAITLMVYSDFQ
ncbi:MAG: hypothetical protein EHM41_21550 [Chloroflexi bacterium]|nr:MAG: hypothetical protein EHM41_21550 [Chloroflexota bacterium]